jgi:hypothetical protein
MLDIASNIYNRPHTTFWPSDEAFSRLPGDIQGQLSDKDYARDIINYHIIEKTKVCIGLVYTVPDSFPWRREENLSVRFRNAIFRGIIATERCCFAQLLKVVYSVLDRCFLARSSESYLS